MSLNPWHKGVVLAFDTESTGVDVSTARIVTACVLKIEPPGQVHERNWLLNPGVDIPAGATKIHGVTTEQARADGTDPAAAVLEIVNTLRVAWEAGWPIIGHNIGCYDLSLLDAELHRHGMGSVRSHGGPSMVVDTLTLDRLIRPHWRGKRTLADCAQAYSVDTGEAHTAGGDAVTAARIAWRMAEEFPTHVQLDLHELMDRQERCHRSWAEEFGAYLRSQQRTDDVQRDWPYRPAVPLAVPA